MELVLYVADEDGQINLEGVVPPGTHYQAARNENTGVVRLTPVKVNMTTAKTAGQDDETELPAAQSRWGE